MKKINLRRYLVMLTVTALISALVSFTASCVPELVIGDLTICKDIDQETFEPVIQKDEFDIETKKIYATIGYSGAKGDDNYRFKWDNENTGETVLDETSQYSEGESGYFEGYAMSYIETYEDVKVVPPGSYNIEFYHNGELKSTASFEVKEPEVSISEVALADEIDENYAPINKTQEFSSTEIVYACVNTDYYISGNTLEAKWYDLRGEVIVETTEDMKVDLYESVWTAFTLEGQGRDIPAGNYSVEIYLNDDLYGSYDFEVTGAIEDIFTQGNKYSNENYGVSFAVPDDWTYTESEDADGLEVDLSPSAGNLPIGFMFIASPENDYPPSSQYRGFADDVSSSIAADNNWEQVGDIQENELVTENGIEYQDFTYFSKDQNGNEWGVVITFIEGSDRLYVLFATVMYDYFDIGESVYYGMLDSMELK